MNPAQELHWLQRTAKDLPTPKLVFVKSLPGADGYFYRPQRAELIIDGGRIISLRRGLLLVVENPDTTVLANAIAHEWRHYWQWFNLPHRFKAERFSLAVDYKQEILRFFKHPRELDALVFSHQKTPCWVSEMWLGWLKEERKS